MTQKRTKIIATIGPASADVEILKQMIKAGMNIARLNFSHGTYTSHAALIKNIRQASAQTGTPVAIMQDLSGPKLRLGEFKDKELKNGEMIILGQAGIPVQRHIWNWIKPGQTILIDDGLIELMAVKVEADAVETKVISGGKIISHKGLSLPGVNIALPSLSEKDLEDLAFGLSQGVDFVAQSFVKKPEDVRKLKGIIKKVAGRQVPVVAKIETAEGVTNITKIIKVADAVMVARGDMALNVKQQLVPVFQKKIVRECLNANVPVIVATQMLQSMTDNPRPTRAEISDVANAVIDHVDAVMLSGETAFGKYPIKAVETMASIVAEIENSSLDDFRHSERRMEHLKNKLLILAHSLVHIAKHSKAQAIGVSSLQLAKALSSFRPECAIVFVSRDEEELKRSLIDWGVLPVKAGGDLNSILRHKDFIKAGQRFIDATSMKLSASIITAE